MPSPARLLLTRPRAQAEDWSRRLAALDVATLSLPLIDIAPAGDAAQAAQAWRDLARMRLVMFVSPNAVAQFFAQRGPDTAWPAGTLAATVGPGSARALAAHGVPDALIVQPPAQARSLDSEHLWPEILRVSPAPWEGCQALLVRGDGGREWLGDRLREAGAAVSAISVYQRRCPELDGAEQALLRQALSAPQSHVWLFSSSEAIGHLEHLATPAPGGPGPDWAPVRAIATHERIAARAQALGVGHVVLVRPDAEAVAAAFRMLSGSTLESST